MTKVTTVKVLLYRSVVIVVGPSGMSDWVTWLEIKPKLLCRKVNYSLDITFSDNNIIWFITFTLKRLNFIAYIFLIDKENVCKTHANLTSLLNYCFFSLKVVLNYFVWLIKNI